VRYSINGQIVTLKNCLVKRALAMMILMVLPSYSSYAASAVIPFEPGERLIYKIKWNKFIIGEVVLDVLPDKKIENVNVRHFYLTGQTSPFADTFYKYRIQIDAYPQVDMKRSAFYTSSDIDRKAEETVVLNFDWINNKVLYSNNKKKKDKTTKKKKSVGMPPDTFDVFSAMYYLRCQVANLGDNKTIRAAVTNGSKVLAGNVYVIGNEIIDIRGHEPKETIHLQLNVNGLGNVHTAKDKSDFMDIWVTTDQYKVPILIKGKSKIGSVIAELVSLEKNDLTRTPMKED